MRLVSKIIKIMILSVVTISCSQSDSWSRKDEGSQESQILLTSEDIQKHKEYRVENAEPGYVPVGDMYVHRDMLEEEDLKEFFPNQWIESQNEVKASGVYSTRILFWPRGILPLKFVGFTSSQQEQFLKYCAIFSQYAQVRCVRRSNQVDYIQVMNTNDPLLCGGSYVGRIEGPQMLEINLSKGCLTQRVVLHELLHTLGFGHEHNKSDRDDHIIVHSNNIDGSLMHNFAKITADFIDTQKYDFDSIMHYNSYAYATDKSRRSMSRRVAYNVPAGSCGPLAPDYKTVDCGTGGVTNEIPYNKKFSPTDGKALALAYGESLWEAKVRVGDFKKILDTDYLTLRLRELNFSNDTNFINFVDSSDRTLLKIEYDGNKYQTAKKSTASAQATLVISSASLIHF